MDGHALRKVPAGRKSRFRMSRRLVLVSESMRAGRRALAVGGEDGVVVFPGVPDAVSLRI